MKINEIFLSIQGEGPQVGMPAWFIRTSGCNLDCDFCDSKYAKDGKEMSIESIVDAVSNNNCKNVIITGGEPFIQKELLMLIKALRDCKVYVETNGTIFKPELIGFATFIVSPKPQFLNAKYMKALRQWVPHATFKFVTGSRKDFNEAITLCKKLGKKNNIYFMPLGIENDEIKSKMISIGEWIKDEELDVWLSPRLQISLYGNKRGV